MRTFRLSSSKMRSSDAAILPWEAHCAPRRGRGCTPHSRQILAARGAGTRTCCATVSWNAHLLRYGFGACTTSEGGYFATFVAAHSRPPSCNLVLRECPTRSTTPLLNRALPIRIHPMPSCTRTCHQSLIDPVSLDNLKPCCSRRVPLPPPQRVPFLVRHGQEL
jgi:hypothetical protein